MPELCLKCTDGYKVIKSGAHGIHLCSENALGTQMQPWSALGEVLENVVVDEETNNPKEVEMA